MTYQPKHLPPSEQQQAFQAFLAKHDYDGSWWGPPNRRPSRFYFGRNHKIRSKAGGVLPGQKAWLEFDDPETCEGVRLCISTKKAWHRGVLVDFHTKGAIAAVRFTDPATADQMQADIEQAQRDGRPVGDLVSDGQA